MLCQTEKYSLHFTLIYLNIRHIKLNSQIYTKEKIIFTCYQFEIEIFLQKFRFYFKIIRSKVATILINFVNPVINNDF